VGEADAVELRRLAQEAVMRAEIAEHVPMTADEWSWAEDARHDRFKSRWEDLQLASNDHWNKTVEIFTERDRMLKRLVGEVRYWRQRAEIAERRREADGGGA
jgi:hypothetical protein